MPSLFAGTGSLICDALRIQDRQHLKRKTLTIEPEPVNDFETPASAIY